MKHLLLIGLLLICQISFAENVDIPAGTFKTIDLGMPKSGLQTMRCDIEILDSYWDEKWGPSVILTLTDAQKNEFLQISAQTTKIDKKYVFAYNEGSIKYGDKKSNFLTAPIANENSISLIIQPLDKDGGTFYFRGWIGNTIKAGSHLINPYLRTNLHYELSLSSIKAKHSCNFL